MTTRFKSDAALIVVLVLALSASVLLARWMDEHRANTNTQFSEQQLYVGGRTAKRWTLAFNGLAADWYWMRSLQYVGGKIVAYEDTHGGQFGLSNLSTLDLRLLPSLLRVTTTLDPQFIPAYEYGAVILPEVNPEEAISLLNHGIAANPSSWRLYQHLGYIYWQRREFERASEIYAKGASLPSAPAWMAAKAARLKAEGGSREAAREMYRHLYEASDDKAVKEMVTLHVMRLDWLVDRDAIRQKLDDFHNQFGRCPTSWRDIAGFFRGTRLQIDAAGSPLDPSGLPYRLINNGCDVDLDDRSRVPR
jgi:tetratricopeptide (TPR) repeat protein